MVACTSSGTVAYSHFVMAGPYCAGADAPRPVRRPPGGPGHRRRPRHRPRGRAVRLAAEGYRVALTARSEDELRETAALLAAETLVLPADMLDPAAPDPVTAAVEQAWGPVSVLVANAGAGSSAPVAKLSDELWARQLELNLTAPFRAVRRVVPAMVEHGWGRIVVVASMAAKRGEPYLGRLLRGKHGVLGLVRAAAAELPRPVSPRTRSARRTSTPPMTEGAVEMIVRFTGRSPEDALRVPGAASSRSGGSSPSTRWPRRSGSASPTAGQRAGHQRRRRRPSRGERSPTSRWPTAPLPEHVVDVRLPASVTGSRRRRWSSSCTAGSGRRSRTARTARSRRARDWRRPATSSQRWSTAGSGRPAAAGRAPDDVRC